MPYIIPSSAITPGAVYQPKKSGLILDQISGAIAAWSTRRLISTAPADIARGRDASTNEEDFTSSELAGTGFTTLAGAGDGFYVTLYDQIGSNNATQATAASQPKGVDTGTLITDGVVPVMEFDGTDDFLSLTSAINLMSDFSLLMRIKFDAFNPYNFWYGGAGTSRLYNLSNSSFRFVASSSSVDFALDSALVTSSYYSIILTRLSNDLILYVNGSAQTDTETLSGTFSISSFTLGTLAFDGSMTDNIIFNRALSASEVSQLHTALA